MRRWIARALTTVVLSAMVSGCASSGDPVERALKTVADGVEEGVEAAESVDEVAVKARFNPCRCPAPDFEVKVYGRWKRIIVAGDDEVLEELRAQAEALDEAPGLGSLRLEGEFDGTGTFEETGIEYKVFRVVGVNGEREDPSERS